MTAVSIKTENRNGLAFCSWADIALISAQLALALLLIHNFQLESRTFFTVMALGSVGFIIHSLLPLRYRLGFFTGLSVAAILLVLGLRDGGYLIAFGMMLIGICHLPIGWNSRIGLLLVAGAVFASWRMELLPAHWTLAVWPALASMFMFRIALYLYSLKHDKKRPGILHSLAYFFMLPNICFPLFPVVDYSGFVRTYYDQEAGAIYHRGMRWIFRGLIHLVLYRLVYMHMMLDPAQIKTAGDVILMVLATFLLYLRVSGQFHLICGILHLFGFRLPRTNQLYFLASGFTDFWRRINIYWKDFMMKLVYYPVYFKFRKRGGNTALIISTAVVFLVTWALHSYQWFWLRGGFPLEVQDALFWGILGVAVAASSLREMKKSRKRRIADGTGWDWGLGFRRLAIFTFLCVLWSLWSSDSIEAWLVVWPALGNVTSRDIGLISLLLVGGFLAAARIWPEKEVDEQANNSRWRRALIPAAAMAAILVVGKTDLYSRYLPGPASIVASLQRSTLNARDAALQHKGYYENLDNASRMSAQLWDVQSGKPAHWKALGSTQAYRIRNDFLRGDLRPGVHILFEDKPLTINQWGMRDLPCPMEKQRGIYRIAVLGPSHVMGSGVADGETFADFLEERLNRTKSHAFPVRYEVYNFGVAGYSLIQQLALLEDRAMKFQPDAVFITDSPGLKAPVISHLGNVIQSGMRIPYADLDLLIEGLGVYALGNKGIPVPYERLRLLLNSLGVHTRMPGREAEQRLRNKADSIIRLTLRHIAAVAQKGKAIPVFIALDNVKNPADDGMPTLKDAQAEGFLVFDLLQLWQNRDESILRVAAWDEHPNEAGNQLIADRIYQMMQLHRARLGLYERWKQ